MKKIVSIFALALCVMLILPASGICENVEASLVTDIEALIATGDQTKMADALEQLRPKQQICGQMENPTDSQTEYCQQISEAIILLEQTLSQD